MKNRRHRWHDNNAAQFNRRVKGKLKEKTIMSKDPMIDERPVNLPPGNPDDPLQPDPLNPNPDAIPPNPYPVVDPPLVPEDPGSVPDEPLPVPNEPNPKEDPPLF
jgi:hypothetical protein